MLVPGTVLTIAGYALTFAGQGWPGVCALIVGAALIGVWGFRKPDDAG